MILEIKKVRECKNGAYGNFIILGHQKARITISMKKNSRLSDYISTLLHEMLHAYATLLRAEGMRVDNKREHRWIEACENSILTLMQKMLKRRT